MLKLAQTSAHVNKNMNLIPPIYRLYTAYYRHEISTFYPNSINKANTVLPVIYIPMEYKEEVI